MSIKQKGGGNMLRRKDVAKLLNLSPRTVIRLEEKKLLTPIKILGSIRYDETEVYNLMKRKEE